MCKRWWIEPDAMRGLPYRGGNLCIRAFDAPSDAVGRRVRGVRRVYANGCLARGIARLGSYRVRAV